MKKAKKFAGYLAEVKLSLASFPNLKPGNHYNSPPPTLGLSVPQSSSALKSGYSFTRLAPEAILEAFDHIWNNALNFEEMSQSIYFYEKKSLCKKEFSVIKDWIDRCDNWAQSDGLSSICSRAGKERFLRRRLQIRGR